MSSFHVTKVLSEFPALRHILTPKEIEGFSHATVERLGIATLNAHASRERRFYFVSRSGQLLRKWQGDGWRGTILGKMTPLKTVVFDIGVDEIGYVAYVEDGNYDGQPYSHLSVLKLPQEGLRQSLKQWDCLKGEVHLRIQN